MIDGVPLQGAIPPSPTRPDQLAPGLFGRYLAACELAQVRLQGWGMARRIAVAALFFHCRGEASTSLALTSATAIAVHEPQTSAGRLKRWKSEARALIEVGMADAWRRLAPLADPSLSDAAALQAIAAEVGAVSPWAAARKRAAMLEGRRGGRPRSDLAPMKAFQEVLGVIERAQSGDRSAHEELAAIRDAVTQA